MSAAVSPVSGPIDAHPSSVGMDEKRLDRLRPLLERYVAEDKLAGWQLMVSRRGQIVHHDLCGMRDREAGLPVESDTVWRIYSMSKPITSIAALMLMEEGLLELRHPVHRYIPSFRDMRVYRGGTAMAAGTEPAREPVRIWHLLTHTAGLTYGFLHAHATDEMHRLRGFEWGTPPGMDLAGACDAWAQIPLAFHPGTEWNYSVATDVLGRVVEVASGMSLDQFFRTRITGPLGMHDTAFWCERDDMAARLAQLYVPEPGTRAARVAPAAMAGGATKQPTFLGGGGGLVSTAADYHRFCRMILGGGSLDGVRLLSPRTVAYASQNHLPGNADLTAFGRPLFAEAIYDGSGFGLGFAVIVDSVQARSVCSNGELSWGGAASTAFWIDPKEELIVVFMTQLLPSDTHPIRSQLRHLVNQALVD
jgi:CubicO group peptidase (beta-lactamase class C family)